MRHRRARVRVLQKDSGFFAEFILSAAEGLRNDETRYLWFS